MSNFFFSKKFVFEVGIWLAVEELSLGLAPGSGSQRQLPANGAPPEAAAALQDTWIALSAPGFSVSS